MRRPLAARAPTTTYRLSPAVDAWLNAEAERLGVPKNSVVEMKLRECMTRSTMTNREKLALRDAAPDESDHD